MSNRVVTDEMGSELIHHGLGLDFGARVRARRGANIETIAVTRKLVCLAWPLLTKLEDYHHERGLP